MSHQNLTALFCPKTVAFVGGSNLTPALRYHRDLNFAGQTWIVNPKYDQIEGVRCFASIDDLPAAPDLAFVAIPREAAIESIALLRDRGCRAVVCNAAGFAETGAEGAALEARLVQAIGPMAALGPNSIGLVNLIDPMAAIMDQFGVARPERGVAIVSQGGGLLCDAVFSDRGLSVTHLVGCGNQAVTGVADCINHLLNDVRVSAIGLSFEGLNDVAALRRAAVLALDLGKPMVALKIGKSAAGAGAALSHTASMIGAGEAWEALFDRLGIVSTRSESEFFETLKLFDSGQIPKGRRVLVTAASGVTGVMLADHLTGAGFEMPQPAPARKKTLRRLLPGIATPGNPQDITMAAWNDRNRQEAIYAALLDEGYDLALMVQNYPRDGMWDMAEFAAQLEALAAACAGRDMAAVQLAPMVDCFPAVARDHTRQLGLAAMQGLDECMAALAHAVWWRERRAVLLAAGSEALADGEPSAVAAAGASSPAGVRLDEAAAKAMIAAAGIPVPPGRVASPEDAPIVAAEIGFPVVIKAVDARLTHKTESGAVHVGLESEQAVADAVDAMRRQMAEKTPDIPLTRILVESMIGSAVAEVLASVRRDPCVGPVMMLAGGGIEAELWNDQTLLAAPFHRAEMALALDRLKVAARIDGWRGSPPGDKAALLTALEALARLAAAVEEVEINPILVARRGVWAVDATLIPSAAASDAPR